MPNPSRMVKNTRKILQTSLILLRTCKTGPILESKGMRAIFQKKSKKGQKNVKNGKIFENLCQDVQNLKIFCKREGDCV